MVAHAREAQSSFVDFCFARLLLSRWSRFCHASKGRLFATYFYETGATVTDTDAKAYEHWKRTMGG